jgi:glycosyltransferase involved in cell wall biosynthesis
MVQQSIAGRYNSPCEGRGALKIVFASHTAMASAFVVGSHHLARALAERGHIVAHISTPVSAAHLFLKSFEARVRVSIWKSGGVWHSPSLYELVPMSILPWKLARYLPFGMARSRLALGRVLMMLGRSGFDEIDVLLVDQPKMVGIEDMLQPRRLVYRATDLYQEMNGGQHMLAAEREIARKAQLLIGTSGPVTQHLHQDNPAKRYMLLENGVEFGVFASRTTPPSEYSSIPAPRLVYAGALDERFDFELIEFVARALPGVNIVLIGPIQGVHTQLRTAPNVHLLGARPYHAIPSYYQHAQVGLLPFSSHAANAGRSPMKLYEYGAARLPVVAVSSAELVRRALPFVILAKDAHEFLRAVQDMLADRGRRALLGDQALKLAEAMSWSSIADRLLNELENV